MLVSTLNSWTGSLWSCQNLFAKCFLVVFHFHPFIWNIKFSSLFFGDMLASTLNSLTSLSCLNFKLSKKNTTCLILSSMINDNRTIQTHEDNVIDQGNFLPSADLANNSPHKCWNGSTLQSSQTWKTGKQKQKIFNHRVELLYRYFSSFYRCSWFSPHLHHDFSGWLNTMQSLSNFLGINCIYYALILFGNWFSHH